MVCRVLLLLKRMSEARHPLRHRGKQRMRLCLCKALTLTSSLSIPRSQTLPEIDPSEV